MVVQHPLASPQAASSINFARKEVGKRFIVTLPVRTQGARRLENSFIEVKENTYRTASDGLMRTTLLLHGLTPADGLDLCLRVFRTRQPKERFLRYGRSLTVLVRRSHHAALWRIVLWNWWHWRVSALWITLRWHLILWNCLALRGWMILRCRLKLLRTLIWTRFRQCMVRLWRHRGTVRCPAAEWWTTLHGQATARICPGSKTHRRIELAVSNRYPVK